MILGTPWQLWAGLALAILAGAGAGYRVAVWRDRGVLDFGGTEQLHDWVHERLGLEPPGTREETA